MNTVAIPAWNHLGLLPPVEASLPTSANRSPYPVSLLDVAMHFTTSPERLKVLSGFLEYRAALHRIGYQSGFQWLNGSFMENVEILENRPPRDIDVVTFPQKLENGTVSDSDLAVLEHDAAKTRFHVDGYFVELDEVSRHELVSLSAYWYSLWSHRRNQAWKGFLQIDLAPLDDVETLTWLNNWGSFS